MRGLNFQHGRQGRELAGWHAHGAEDQFFHVGLGGLEQVDYLGDLLADNLVVEEGTAEGFAFEGVAVGIFVGDAAEAEGCDAYPEAFVGEGYDICSVTDTYKNVCKGQVNVLDIIISKP